MIQNSLKFTLITKDNYQLENPTGIELLNHICRKWVSGAKLKLKVGIFIIGSNKIIQTSTEIQCIYLIKSQFVQKVDVRNVVIKIRNALETELMLGAVITSSTVQVTSSYTV